MENIGKYNEEHLTTYNAKSYMCARLSGFDSAWQGRKEARQAGCRQDNTQDVPSAPAPGNESDDG